MNETAGSPDLDLRDVVARGGWSVFINGLPVAVGGPTFDAAVDEMIRALREYAHDWRGLSAGRAKPPGQLAVWSSCSISATATSCRNGWSGQLSELASGSPLNTSLVCQLTWTAAGTIVPGRGASFRLCKA
jgi:hypothetical protein